MIDLIETLSKRLSAVNEPWALVGSSNLLVRGCVNHANDVDIITTRTGVLLIYKCLLNHAISQVADSRLDNIESTYFSASFDGIKVEVMGDPKNKINNNWVLNDQWINKVEKFLINDVFVNLTTLEYEKEINEKLNNIARVATIKKCIKKQSR